MPAAAESMTLGIRINRDTYRLTHYLGSAIREPHEKAVRLFVQEND